MNPTAIALRNLDPLRGGRAELTIDAPEIVPARLSVTIRRGAANKSFLGPAGWQQSEHLFLAESFAESGDRLTLVLGPDVVDNDLRDFEVIELTFPEVGMIGQVTWEGITRSVALAPEAPPPPRPEPEPVPPPPLPGGNDGRETVVGDPGGDPAGDKDDRGRSRMPLIAGAIVLALIAGGAAFWLTREEPPVGDADQTAVVTPAPPTGDDPVATPPADDDPAAAPPAGDAMQEAYDRGLAALEAGDCATAQQELRPALDAGHGPTLLLWAQRQDSVEFAPCLSETSNDIRALANYQRACEAGTPEVMAPLQALLDELKRRSDRGDAVAGDVLEKAAPRVVAACQGQAG